MDTSEEADVKLGGAVKQTDEKHASSELREMVWSPKMDLVAAVALPEPNDVILYRFHSLAKLWTHPSPSDTSIVRCLAWGPLGKCKDFFYIGMMLCLCDIMSKRCNVSVMLLCDAACMFRHAAKIA